MVKHGLVVSDLHCGHLVGLTPPRWQIRQPKGTLTKREKWYAISRALWDTFETELSKLPPLDLIRKTLAVFYRGIQSTPRAYSLF